MHLSTNSIDRLTRRVPGVPGPLAKGPRHGRAGTHAHVAVYVCVRRPRPSTALIHTLQLTLGKLQEQFIDLQEDLIAIAECTNRLAEERRRIMVRLVCKPQLGLGPA